MLIVLMNLPLHLMVNAGGGVSTAQKTQDTGKPSTNKSRKKTQSQKTREKQEPLIKKQANPSPEIQEKTELSMDLPLHLTANARGGVIKKQPNYRYAEDVSVMSSINHDNELGNPNRQDDSDESGSDCSSRDDSGSDDSGIHEFDKQIADTDYFNEKRNTASEKVLRTNGIASTAQNGEKNIHSEGYKPSREEKIQNEYYEVSEEKSGMVKQMSTEFIYTDKSIEKSYEFIHPDKNIGPNKIIDSLVSSTNTEMRYQQRKHDDTQSFQYNPLESVSSSKQLKSKTEPESKAQHETLAARLDRAIKGNAEQKNNIQGAREDRQTRSERRRIRAEKKAKINKQQETVSWFFCCCKKNPSSKPSSKTSKSRKKTNNNRDSIDPNSANAILLTIKMKNQEQEINQKTTNITDYNQEQESGQRVSDPKGDLDNSKKLIMAQLKDLLESTDN